MYVKHHHSKICFHAGEQAMYLQNRVESQMQHVASLRIYSIRKPASNICLSWPQSCTIKRQVEEDASDWFESRLTARIVRQNERNTCREYAEHCLTLENHVLFVSLAPVLMSGAKKLWHGRGSAIRVWMKIGKNRIIYPRLAIVWYKRLLKTQLRLTVTLSIETDSGLSLKTGYTL